MRPLRGLLSLKPADVDKRPVRPELLWYLANNIEMADDCMLDTSYISSPSGDIVYGRSCACGLLDNIRSVRKSPGDVHAHYKVSQSRGRWQMAACPWGAPSGRPDLGDILSISGVLPHPTPFRPPNFSVQLIAQRGISATQDRVCVVHRQRLDAGCWGQHVDSGEGEAVGAPFQPSDCGKNLVRVPTPTSIWGFRDAWRR